MHEIFTRKYYTQPAWITISVNFLFLGILTLAGIWDIISKSRDQRLAKLGKLLYSALIFSIAVGLAAISINCTMVGVKGGGTICKVFAWLNAIFMIITPILFMITMILGVFMKLSKK